MVTATTTLGERGLVRLPATIREDADLARGQELIMIVEGPGRVTLTTREAIQSEVWAAAPGPTAGPGGPDSVEDVRAYRAADRARVDEKSAQAAQLVSEQGPNPAGDALLDALGVGRDV